VEEFLYLLDYIFTYQLLEDTGTIQIRLPNGRADAANIFERAKTRYGEEYWAVLVNSQQHFQERLKRIVSFPRKAAGQNQRFRVESNDTER
jgi:hypothetical protein